MSDEWRELRQVLDQHIAALLDGGAQPEMSYYWTRLRTLRDVRRWMDEIDTEAKEAPRDAR